MSRTIGQAILDNLVEKLGIEEAKIAWEMKHRHATERVPIYRFERYCEKNNLRPTWHRYKKYLDLQEKILAEYINSSGKVDRFEELL